MSALGKLRWSLRATWYTLNGWRFQDLKDHIDARIKDVETKLGVATGPARSVRPLPSTGCDALDVYISQSHKIEGWLHPYSMRFIVDLALHQTKSGIHGSTGEIGVHHGLLFLALKLATARDEKSFVIDVFGDQHLNVDASGRGDYDIFVANHKAWAGDMDRTTIFAKMSNKVTPDEIVSACGSVRMMSIDGGHNEETAHGDLYLAESVLSINGVAIIDDFFNQYWPGVAAGAARYFLDPKSELKPFAISPNKVYAAKNPALYRDIVMEIERPLFEKTVKMFGHDVHVFGCHEKTLAANGY